MKMISSRDKTAFIDSQKSYSYAQLIAKIGDWQTQLEQKGAKRVLILSENRVEYIFALYGSWLAGSEVIPVDALSTVDEISYIISDARPDLIITSKLQESLLIDAIKESKVEIPVMLMESEIPQAKEPITSVEINDLEKNATIIYTSGTTGSPKGVILSFANMMSNVKAVSEDVPYFTDRETVLMLLPIHHILPLMGTVTSPLYGGCTIALSPSLKGEDIIHTLAAHKVTLMVGVPRLYEVILRGILTKIEASAIARFIWRLAGKIESRAIRKKLFSSVHKKFGGHIRWFIAGGAKLDIEITKGYQRLGFEILEGYGMSETSPIIAFPRHDDYRLGSVGQPLLKDSVRIQDGEIYVRGAQVMKGYLNKPEATAETFDGEWLKTGDLGYLDDDNYLYITGRKKEIIILPSGKNIQPEELEGKLVLAHNLISEAAIFLDKKQQLHALIVPDMTVAAEKEIKQINDYIRWEILDIFNRKLQPYKRINGFTLLSEPLPRTRMQKLKRFLLPDLIEEKVKKGNTATKPDSPLYAVIATFLEKIAGEKISPDDHIEVDLGIDSLDRMELIALIAKESGTTLSDEDIANNPTPKKMVAFIEKEKNPHKTQKKDWKRMLHTATIENMPYSGLPQKMVAPLLIAAVRLYFKLSCDCTAPPHPTNSTIFASNHQSFLDALFITTFMPKAVFYKTYFFAKEKHFNKPWKRWLGKRINVVIMKNNASAIDALKSMAFVLRNGGHVMIFPEGTRTRDGKVKTFKNSFALLAREIGVPITPIAIKGAFEAFPIHSKRPHFRAPIEISFLDQVRPGSYTQQELSDAVKRRIEHHLG
ncbi:AMP-binding protein [bacterium]|nr:AMP-binding protein [bacterium]